VGAHPLYGSSATLTAGKTAATTCNSGSMRGRRLPEHLAIKKYLFGFHGKLEQLLAACPIRAQNPAQLRSLTANHGQPFSFACKETASQSVSVLVFQAGHASSILVNRSTATALVNCVIAGRKISVDHSDSPANSERRLRRSESERSSAARCRTQLMSFARGRCHTAKSQSRL
jgi:hypothetical protein